MNDLTILKLGSSVLRTEDDIPIAVSEIYREWRSGRRVIAVVSALGDTTDELLARARRVTDEPDPEALATLLATGEATAVALVALALQRSGIPAQVLDADRIGLVVDGPPLDARPADLDPCAVEEALKDRPVAVVPGFVGRGRRGGPALLGRGGSDWTALFLAHRLGATECRLIKDVDGIFEWDPARGGPAPTRYRRVTWDRAAQAGAQLVQPQAVQFARTHGLSFCVAAAGSAGGTLVDGGPVERERPAAQRPLRVALLGCGTVGGGLLRRLRAAPQRLEVVGVAVRDPARHAHLALPDGLLSDDPWDVVRRPADLVVEVLGGLEPSAPLIAEALRTGRDVVTANKAVIALRGAELIQLAERHGRRLRYSAAVGGAVPVLEWVRALAERGPILSVEGVLNGTSNFVLDRLAAGASLADAVCEAQELGFAEADPTLDLDGSDSLHKLVLTVAAAYGEWLDPDQLPKSGVDQLRPEVARAAHRQEQSIRLIASARRAPEGVQAVVAPTVLPADHPLAYLRGAENGVVVTPCVGPQVVLRGLGAGRWPTAEAVLSDVLDVYRERAAASPHESIAASGQREIEPDAEAEHVGVASRAAPDVELDGVPLFGRQLGGEDLGTHGRVDGQAAR